MKKILITRPKEQATELANFINSSGNFAFIEPIFEVEFYNYTKINYPFLAIIITSINAVSALEAINPKKNIKIFTLGKKLSEKLTNLGFTNLTIAKDSAAQLFIEIAKFNEAILYLRGERISFDFAAQFKNILEIVTYKIVENRAFSENFLNFCKNNNFDEILLFSKNSGETFISLLKRHNLLANFINSKMVCLSKNICDFLDKSGFKNHQTFAENLIVKKFYD